MAKIIVLPHNFFTPEDRKALESFGAHELSRGRATRYHWGERNEHEPVFEMFRGGADEELVFWIARDQTQNMFMASDPRGRMIVSGNLSHVMAELDDKLLIEHGEEDRPAG